MAGAEDTYGDNTATGNVWHILPMNLLRKVMKQTSYLQQQLMAGICSADRFAEEITRLIITCFSVSST